MFSKEKGIFPSIKPPKTIFVSDSCTSPSVNIPPIKLLECMSRAMLRLHFTANEGPSGF